MVPPPYRTAVSSSSAKPRIVPMNTSGRTCIRGTKPGVAVTLTLGVNPVCATVIPVVAFATGPRRLAPIRMSSKMPKSRPMLWPIGLALMSLVGVDTPP